MPDGPHSKRFDRPDTFDKSNKLTKNPQVKSIPNFYRQLKRDDDSILKAGKMIDMRNRVELVYEKSDPVLLLQKDQKNV